MGGIQDLFTDETKQTQRQESQLIVGKADEQELLGQDLTTSNLRNLSNLISQGPGAAEVTGAKQEASTFLDLLRNTQARSGFADDAQIAAASQFANKVFGAQREQLSQDFEDQSTRTSRLAAQLGRPVNDPILQAKLAQEQTRQSRLLSAQQGAFTAQAAQGAVQQQLGLGQQLFNVRQGLATQAMQNRQTLMSLGSQVQQMGRQFRLNTGKQVGTASGTTTTTPGLGNIALGVMGAGAEAGATVAQAGGLAAVFSDERVKTNVKKVSLIDDFYGNLNAYEYEYTSTEYGDAGRHIGVMAQDLEKSELGKRMVSETPDGVKMVDYAQALPVLLATVTELYKEVKDLKRGN